MSGVCEKHHYDRVKSYCFRMCRHYPERSRNCDYCFKSGFDVSRGALKECYECDIGDCMCGDCWMETASIDLQHYYKAPVILTCVECNGYALCNTCWDGRNLVCKSCRQFILKNEGITNLNVKFINGRQKEIMSLLSHKLKIQNLIFKIINYI